jgi:hypothetical protein
MVDPSGEIAIAFLSANDAIAAAGWTPNWRFVTVPGSNVREGRNRTPMPNPTSTATAATPQGRSLLKEERFDSDAVDSNAG